MKRFRQWLGFLGGALLLAGAAWWFFLRPSAGFDALIRFATDRYGMDPALIKAVVWQESRFTPDAVGRAGEIGLMQVTEVAAQEWAEAEGVFPLPREHLFDPQTNLLAGTWYLRRSLRRHGKADDPLPFALAEYNAGRGNVLKWLKGTATTNSAAFIKAIGFPGTQAYVKSILARRLRYLADFPSGLADSPH
jgi:soluble lytic murein transglycosylase